MPACIGLLKPTDCSLRVKAVLSQRLRVPLAALRSKSLIEVHTSGDVEFHMHGWASAGADASCNAEA